jgi:hypothetical protein
MHSASVNSEPGSNSPLNLLAISPGKDTGVLSTESFHWSELTKDTYYLDFNRQGLCAPAVLTPNIFLTPSTRRGLQGAHSLAKTRLSKNEKEPGLLASAREAGGKFTLPLGSVFYALPND